MKTLRMLLSAVLALTGLALGAAAEMELDAQPSIAAAAAARQIIGFAPGTSQAERQRIVKSLGGTIVDTLDELDAVVVEVAAGRVSSFAEAADLIPSILDREPDRFINWLNSVDAAAPALPGLGELRRGIPSFHKSADILIADQGYPLPAGVKAEEIPWGIARVNAPNAWAKSQGRGVRVAVIDTGIDFNHPDIKSNYAGGFNALDKKAPPMDDNRHGTHVAGTIAGLWDNKGVAGVAPQARLYAVKVLNKDGGGSLTSIIKGLLWCARNDIQLANMSLGSPMGSIFMRLAVQYAAKKGVVLIAAAGNNAGKVGYPAGYDDVIAISASDVKDKMAEFSSRGKKVEFIAPGVAVKSSIPGGGYDTFSGTSMATPHVTGLAALAVAQGAAGLEGVRASLRRAASSIGLPREHQGNGLIDAAKVTR
jgi:subtilisin family serine protease